MLNTAGEAKLVALWPKSAQHELAVYDMLHNALYDC